MKNVMLMLVVLSLILACQSSSSNEGGHVSSIVASPQDEWDKVIAHFSRGPADSVKLRAAHFLIRYLPGHHFQELPDANSYQPALDSVVKYHRLGRDWEGVKRFNRIVDSLQGTHLDKFCKLL